jgi:uncharacterized protein YeaO (DUF488 family)
MELRKEIKLEFGSRRLMIMSLKETYVANVSKLKKQNPSAIFIAVTRTSPRFKYTQWLKSLAPSSILLQAHRNGLLKWEDYVGLYKKEMDNEESKADMQWVKELAKSKDVYLVCFEKAFPCHRFLLMEMIEVI